MPERPEQGADLERLAVLDEPVRRRLYDFVRASGAPVGRDAAARAADIGRSLAAYHLDKLTEHGYLTTTFERPEGRGGPGAGRPAKLYAAAEGELSVSVPAREYEFAARLLAAAAEADPTGAARTALDGVAGKAGAELGEELSREPPDRSLEEALARRGYEPFEDEAGVLRLRNCPFHRLAADHRELVCGMNQAYLAGLLAGLGRGDFSASLEPEPGRCCVAIRGR